MPPGDFKLAAESFVGALRSFPADGLAFREFRDRLKKREMWNRDRFPVLLKFLRMAHTDPMMPSQFMIDVAEAADMDAALDRVADRLWTLNPVILHAVFTRLADRVHSPNELLKYIDSFAYPGARLTGPEIRNWLRLAQGIGLLRTIGIRLTLDDRAERLAERVKHFDLDDFFDEDEEEIIDSAEVAPVVQRATPEPVAPTSVAPAQQSVAPAPMSIPEPTIDLPSPIGRERPVPVRQFRDHAVFPESVQAKSRTRILGWWSEQTVESPWPDLNDFAIDGDTFNEDPDYGVFLVAVAAALTFRLSSGKAGVIQTFHALRDEGLLDVLFEGTVPNAPPANADAHALMLASLVARRCAEHPDLSTQVERAEDAKAAFAHLDAALGRGLFGLELFWLLRQLGTLGLVRSADLPTLTTVPDRTVRDTLFRLGFIEQPYAVDSAALIAGAAAARAALPDTPDPGLALTLFTRAAGCSYDCPQRRRCDLPCRERADLG